NGRLVLACVPDIIKKILKTVELEDLFEVYENVDDAVASF
ncbi:anti-sigma factor antagonist, partial [Brachyspira hampsonii]|nr:anti-sigma factor antagonist [Brachyspira hampsonii]